MVSILIGAIVIVGAISIFLSNKQSYRTNQGLGEIQDGVRTAFELMARDIRTSGLTGCVNNNRAVNVLGTGGGQWWAGWTNSIIGYDENVNDPAVTSGTSTGNRLADTDSIAMLSVEGIGLSVEGDGHDTGADTFTMNETTTDIQKGDIVAVCDPDHVAVFQVTNVAGGGGSGIVLTHATGGGMNPGNSTNQLGFPSGTYWKYADDSGTYGQAALAQIARVNAIDWYVGVNPDGGRSLYRSQLVNVSDVPTSTAYEMIRNVSNMQIQYHEAGRDDFRDADATSPAIDWDNVDAVQVSITIDSEGEVGIDATGDATTLSRTFMSTTTIRNRVN
jgi:type IV pilus assembly protein PilW